MSDSDIWQSVQDAAGRLGRSPGHIARVCPELVKSGLARWIKGGGKKARWQVRIDAQPFRPAFSTPLKIDITVNGVGVQFDNPAAGTIDIAIDGADIRIVIPTRSVAPREALEASSKDLRRTN
jgi:hypothetical protein